jgi:hypothetical protein
MPKNWIGREDNSFDGMNVVQGTAPSIEGAVQSLTGVTLPFVDVTRGGGALLNNAVVIGEGVMRRSAQPQMPPAENALAAPQQSSADRIRELREMYLANQRAAAGRGKSFYPSQE